MSSLGRRNWRGQIVEPLANFAAADVAVPNVPEERADDHNQVIEPSKKKSKKHKKHKTASSGRRKAGSEDGDVDSPVEYVKDEFGRDVPVERSRQEEKKPKKKHRRHHHSRSRSTDAQRRVRSPPPEDPFRPQLDDGRAPSKQHGRRQRAKSRSRSRNRERTRPRRREPSRSRSASPRRRHSGRRRSRSRSRSRARDTGRVWTHDGFENRSPSPVRDVLPGYKPEPEQWVSRAGGVYLPRRN